MDDDRMNVVDDDDGVAFGDANLIDSAIDGDAMDELDIEQLERGGIDPGGFWLNFDKIRRQYNK